MECLMAAENTAGPQIQCFHHWHGPCPNTPTAAPTRATFVAADVYQHSLLGSHC
jgi:hypothetical protein